MQNFRAQGAPHPDPHWPPVAGGSAPTPLKTAPHCEFLAPHLAWELVNNAAQSSLCDAQHALLLFMSVVCRKLLLHQFSNSKH